MFLANKVMMMMSETTITHCVLAERFSGRQCTTVRRAWYMSCSRQIYGQQMISRWCYSCCRPENLLYKQTTPVIINTIYDCEESQIRSNMLLL